MTHKSGKKKYSRWLVLSLLIVALVVGGIYGSLALLTDETDPVENTFEPTEVTIEIEEDFDGVKKENIKVTNIGDVDAYVRVRLVSYWQNASGNIVAKDSWFSDAGLTLGEGWFKAGDYYYYANPVKVNAFTAEALFAEAITLTNDPSDGTNQVLEVLAEAVQASPEEAVEDLWPAVEVKNGKLVAAAVNP